jgi:hypothetical protein
MVAPQPEAEAQQPFVLETTKKIDLLFVIDNSLSMREEQASLTANFPRFMREIEKGGLPDLQIAIVSTDFGAGGISQDKCRLRGDDGQFRTQAACPLKPGSSPFLQIARDGQKNFDGALTDVFACMATLGIEGCGYEHTLQSMRVALSTHNQASGAFLRPDAHLGIIIISDEDDCSADPDATLFNDVRVGQNPNLRCATAGHSCQGTPVPGAAMTTTLGACRPQEHAADEASRRAGLINIATFVNHVKALKAPDRRVLVAGVFGWSDDPATPYTIRAQDGALDLDPICNTAAGKAAPAIRLKAFVDAFGADGSWHSICGADLSAAMTKFGVAVARLKGDTCLQDRPLDVQPETPALDVDCVVEEQEPGAEPRLLPLCAPGRPDCFEVKEDPTCPGSGVRLVTARAVPAPEGTSLKLRCRAPVAAAKP